MIMRHKTRRLHRYDNGIYTFTLLAPPFYGFAHGMSERHSYVELTQIEFDFVFVFKSEQ